MLKRILIIVIPAIFCCLSVNAQTAWVTVTADKNISVKFPSAPIKKKGVYTYTNKDSTIVLVVSIRSQDEYPPGETPFDDLFKTEDAESKKDTTEPTFETGQWEGYPTTTMSLKDPKRLLSIYIINIGDEAYIFGVFITSDKYFKVQGDFLSSIKLTK